MALLPTTRSESSTLQMSWKRGRSGEQSSAAADGGAAGQLCAACDPLTWSGMSCNAKATSSAGGNCVGAAASASLPPPTRSGVQAHAWTLSNKISHAEIAPAHRRWQSNGMSSTGLVSGFAMPLEPATLAPATTRWPSGSQRSSSASASDPDSDSESSASHRRNCVSASPTAHASTASSEPAVATSAVYDTSAQLGAVLSCAAAASLLASLSRNSASNCKSKSAWYPVRAPRSAGIQQQARKRAAVAFRSPASVAASNGARLPAETSGTCCKTDDAATAASSANARATGVASEARTSLSNSSDSKTACNTTGHELAGHNWYEHNASTRQNAPGDTRTPLHFRASAISSKTKRCNLFTVRLLSVKLGSMVATVGHVAAA
mmetsp:Transcript_39688/g.109309  ORF Transcript_39688/g.109309 Transcript_39688/m.109309 type:complete len:378 (+) Transcript_39688:797-1930(+)